ncbi:MAG: PilZ domain-containing protein [Pseudomonadota bacterium]
MAIKWFKKIYYKYFGVHSQRVRIADFHDIDLGIMVSSTANYQKFEVVNLSTTGAAIRRPKDQPPGDFALEQLMKGYITIRKKTVEVEFQVMHLTNEIVGLQVQNVHAGYASIVIDYLKTELLGIRCQLMPKEHLKPDPDGEALWYYSEKNFQLYLVLKEGKVIKFRLTVWEDFAELHKNNELKFGHLVENKLAKNSAKSSVKKIPEATLTNFKRFINAIAQLDSEHRKQIVEHLQREITPE